MNTYRPLLALLFAVLLVHGSASQASAQIVDVRMSLGTNLMFVGETRTLQVSACIVTNQWPNTDRIFSWYVDLLNTTGGVAIIQATNLSRAASDKDPRLSSPGVVQGSNVRGIYDTFMNRPGAGRSNWVELFSVPITAVAAGQTTFRLTAGTGVSDMTADFIVAPLGGGDPLIGGSYTQAQVVLKVVSDPNGLRLSLASEAIAPQQYRVTVTFVPRPGWNHYVEYRDHLETGSWQTLPFGPHNLGMVTATNAISQRFYRVRLTL